MKEYSTSIVSKQQFLSLVPRTLSLLLLFLLFSCTRTALAVHTPVENASTLSFSGQGARPMAILQTGEYPLWFQLTDEGPILLGSIEDAILSSAFVPWPFAMHIHSFNEKEDELVMAVNRDGFMVLKAGSGALEMYRFSHSFWKQYTVGGFVYYGENPVALLYSDDFFLDSPGPLPDHRTWTFNMESNIPFPFDIPVLDFFPVEEGWSVDTLRSGSDGQIYYRARRRDSAPPEVRMFRTADFSQVGEEISMDIFYGSVHSAQVFLPSLPPLPEGFVYTGFCRIGDSLFASWEEQIDFSIGAAGFMVIME